jgi:hypothetical protein
MLQPQPMFFDLEKFFVEGKNFGRAFRTRGAELVLGMSEDLFQMSRHPRLNLSASGKVDNGTGGIRAG